MVRSLHCAAISLSLLAAFAFFLPDASAQKPMARDLLMRLEGMTTRDQEKAVLGALNDQDPAAVVSVDVPSQQVKIRTGVVLDRPLLEARLGAAGMTILSLGPISIPAFEQRASASSVLPGFPQFINTDDPANDEAVYQANKAAWIAAHPELYTPAGTPATPEPR